MYVLKARIFDLTLSLPPFIYHFWQRKYPFCIPSMVHLSQPRPQGAFPRLWRWAGEKRPGVEVGTFQIPSREIHIPFNCRKCTVSCIWTNRKTRTAFSRPSHSHKMRHLGLLGHFTNRKWQISLPFHIFKLLNLLLFSYTWRLKTRRFSVQAIIPPPPPGAFTHSPLEICRTTCFKASRAVFWSVSCYKELKLIIKLFTGRTSGVVHFAAFWFSLRSRACAENFQIVFGFKSRTSVLTLTFCPPLFFRFSCLIFLFCWEFSRLHFGGKSFKESS